MRITKGTEYECLARAEHPIHAGSCIIITHASDIYLDSNMGLAAAFVLLLPGT